MITNILKLITNSETWFYCYNFYDRLNITSLILGVPLVFFISILSYYGSNLRLDKANMLSRSANNKLRK